MRSNAVRTLAKKCRRSTDREKNKIKSRRRRTDGRGLQRTEGENSLGSFFVPGEESEEEQMNRENRDIRAEIVKNGLTYAEVARHMRISPVWLSKVLSKKLTPDMRRRINIAIDELTLNHYGRA